MEWDWLKTRGDCSFARRNCITRVYRIGPKSGDGEVYRAGRSISVTEAWRDSGQKE